MQQQQRRRQAGQGAAQHNRGGRFHLSQSHQQRVSGGEGHEAPSRHRNSPGQDRAFSPGLLLRVSERLSRWSRRTRRRGVSQATFVSSAQKQWP
ncbi:unnamed protein product [Lampetra fluviatilis]